MDARTLNLGGVSSGGWRWKKESEGLGRGNPIESPRNFL